METYILDILRDRQTHDVRPVGYGVYACFFHQRGKIIVGENSPVYAYSWIPIATHAEIDALQKLRVEYIKGNGRPLKMNLMVVRISKTGKLGTAEPCRHCMRQLEMAKYVKIKYVYYSVGEQITCRKFTDMLQCPTQFISQGYRHRMKMDHGKKMIS